MKLTSVERGMLDGDQGPAVKRAMEIIVSLGRIFHADDLVPVDSVQVSGISYKNIGPYGLEFLAEWAGQGAKARVPAYMNPGGHDRRLWERLGVSAAFAERQEQVIVQLERMNVIPFLSCTPYHVFDPPTPGRHIAWAESSAVVYANSVLGARTNREGGPSALAAAITGRTARYGLHTDQGRQARIIASYRGRDLETPSDFGALGARVGKLAGGKVVYYRHVDVPENEPQRTWSLKALGAAMAASGAVGLFHIEGVTPEAAGTVSPPVAPDAEELVIDEIDSSYRGLGNDRRGSVDVVFLGCPHLSIDEIERVARRVAGKKLAARLWITSSQPIREQAEERGYVSVLEGAGATLIADSCMVVAPLVEMGVKSIATESAKAAVYIPSHHGLPVFFGTLEQCLEAAESGLWRP